MAEKQQQICILYGQVFVMNAELEVAKASGHGAIFYYMNRISSDGSFIEIINAHESVY